MKYGKVTAEIRAELEAVVGAKNIWINEEKLESCSRDETTTLRIDEHFMPEVVLAPEDAEQVSAILKIANKYLLPVTPRGGGTGLSGGALPVSAMAQDLPAAQSAAAHPHADRGFPDGRVDSCKTGMRGEHDGEQRIEE